MLAASCHCGAVTLSIEAPLTQVTDCNCSICRRYGVLWAYFSPAQVRITASAPQHGYQWDDRSITFHRCATCGCVTHWSAVDPAVDRMGVNARLLPLDVLATARVRELDGANTEQYRDLVHHGLREVTPILRSFDEGKAREFYVDWLGFQVVFEHRFEPGLPLYMGIQRGACRLHLSEHHGDGSPGAAIRIRVDELEAFHAEVSAKKYKNYRPGLQDQEWGTREMVVQDGAGNKLIFFRDLR